MRHAKRSQPRSILSKIVAAGAALVALAMLRGMVPELQRYLRMRSM